ncbi:hypothetical protein [Chitinophaga varians]|uniref:hypothetical protein n=1 Tax=Chitinophaga varians TaxID=2202339 RepID=UPI00165FA3F1|nr:hypothetical protein [Chitinophaga varians]MBC9913508.1 hypothetical protein [Chitinophaga varians]
MKKIVLLTLALFSLSFINVTHSNAHSTPVANERTDYVFFFVTYINGDLVPNATLYIDGAFAGNITVGGIGVQANIGQSYYIYDARYNMHASGVITSTFVSATVN